MFEEFKALGIKILLPALVAVSMKIAIQSREKSVTVINVIISMITGLGSAYLFSGLITSHFSNEYIPLVIAVITLSGEKIGYYVIYKMKIDEYIMSMIQFLIKDKK